jgi:hypothetical protein
MKAMKLDYQTDPSPSPLPFGRGEEEHPALGVRREVHGKGAHPVRAAGMNRRSNRLYTGTGVG